MKLLCTLKAYASVPMMLYVMNQYNAGKHVFVHITGQKDVHLFKMSVRKEIITELRGGSVIEHNASEFEAYLQLLFMSGNASLF